MSPVRREPLGWHAGERKMHALMHTPSDMPNFASPFLTPNGAQLLQQAPLIVVGTMDAQERIWTTVWGGEPGFARSLGSSIMAVKTVVDHTFDPVIGALFGDGEATEEGQALRGQEIAALSIDLATRSRLKLAGKVIAGSLIRHGDQAEESTSRDDVELQLAIKVESSLGNCPKYLNKKDIVPTLPEPRLLADSLPLPNEALDVIRASDLFFLTSSLHGDHLSTNIRGGPPGFVRVVSNSSSLLELVYPEYSGNRMYQTLGNLQLDPSVGLVFPDFQTGDVLYVSGVADILMGDAASEFIPRQNLLMKLSISHVRFVRHGLGFRGSVIDYSPYNPPVRYLASEKPSEGKATGTTAELISQEIIAPGIARLRFRVNGSVGPNATWTAGQYAALSFASHFDRSYSHMRDEDPRSLNDDYVRSFTVSSPPATLPTGEFELTVRQVGKVTDLLLEEPHDTNLTVDLLSFAGDFRVDQSHDSRPVAFIAGGIGITSLLGQLATINLHRLRLFWAFSAHDIPLVTDTFARNPGLAASTRLYISGTPSTTSDATALRLLEDESLSVATRRLAAGDVLEPGLSDRYYMCVSPGLRKQLMQWLEGKQCLYEDFGF